ncbi:MAG: thiamine diphosphokinase [bacterium]|nr:thiamine diphosphokinase [bacterium]
MTDAHKNRAVIITSYLEYPLDIPALTRAGDYIVCLDGGWDIARQQGVRADLLLGDFDSIQGPLPGEDGGPKVLRYPPEKDYTDLELALRVLDADTTPDVLIIGGLGGRLDQTIINVQMLARYTGDPFDRIELMDGHNRCFVLHGGAQEEGPCIIPSQPDSYLSLLPLTEECTGVYLQGAKYPLSDAVLHKSASIGISNEFYADQAELRLARGTLLVVISKGNENDISIPSWKRV